MKIRNFYASDMYDVMLKIKQELGEEAVIISKKRINQKGFFGFLKPKIFEVTAAVETDTKSKEEKIISMKKTEADDILKNEISEIKETVKKLFEDKNQGIESIVEYKEDISEVFRMMDLDEKVIHDFDTYCKHRSVGKDQINKIILYEFLMNRFNNKINIRQNDSRVIVFVGPTGVGKTTTIAKIASRESLVNHKKVGLVTIDTYRIGAIEQLKIYANILDISLEVVNQKEEMEEAMENLSDCDIVLVDTTGMSYKNHNQLIDLKGFIDEINDKEVSLVLSMTCKSTDFAGITENYQLLNFDNFILTKFDETQSYGNILNMMYLSNKPLSYISMGQVVPDDLEFASREVLFKYIWGDMRS